MKIEWDMAGKGSDIELIRQGATLHYHRCEAGRWRLTLWGPFERHAYYAVVSYALVRGLALAALASHPDVQHKWDKSSPLFDARQCWAAAIGLDPVLLGKLQQEGYPYSWPNGLWLVSGFAKIPDLFAGFASYGTRSLNITQGRILRKRILDAEGHMRSAGMLLPETLKQEVLTWLDVLMDGQLLVTN